MSYNGKILEQEWSIVTYGIICNGDKNIYCTHDKSYTMESIYEFDNKINIKCDRLNSIDVEISSISKP